tara:strand:+ start:588 stop:764 length:177 start_codon:yes stop_codon:yes gene_type:complete
MTDLEKRNHLVQKVKILKEMLIQADFMKKMEIKDEIIELENTINEIDIMDKFDGCKIC